MGKLGITAWAVARIWENPRMDPAVPLEIALDRKCCSTTRVIAGIGVFSSV